MKQRIITGGLAGSLFLIMMILGGPWYSALITLLAFIGYDEYLRMIGMKQNRMTYVIGLIGMLILVVPWNFFHLSGVSFLKAIWIVILLLLTITVTSKNKITIDQVAILFTGIVYLGYGFHYMISTRLLEPNGLFWTSLVLVCIWATDSGAYFAGMLFGKHLLWPTISPKKTVEGAMGGLALSIVAAVCFSLYAPELISITKALLIAVVIAVVGHIGDLIQSAYKRVKGIKDTGTLLPGHGGVLDRVDSWLIVFPFVALLSLIPQ